MVLSCVAAITIDVIIIATEASIVQNCKKMYSLRILTNKTNKLNLVKVKVIKTKLYIKSFLLLFIKFVQS